MEFYLKTRFRYWYIRVVYQETGYCNVCVTRHKGYEQQFPGLRHSLLYDTNQLINIDLI